MNISHKIPPISWKHWTPPVYHAFFVSFYFTSKIVLLSSFNRDKFGYFYMSIRVYISCECECDKLCRTFTLVAHVSRPFACCFLLFSQIMYQPLWSKIRFHFLPSELLILLRVTIKRTPSGWSPKRNCWILVTTRQEDIVNRYSTLIGISLDVLKT